MTKRARPEPTPKPCFACQQPMTRARKHGGLISWRAWDKKTTCSNPCAGKWRSHKRRDEWKTKIWEMIAIDEKTSCWLWQGYINPHGYGMLGIGKSRVQRMVHRLAYILHHGDIPPHLIVRHICDVRDCINPEHLILGTMQDNTWDAIKRGRFIHSATALANGRKLSDIDAGVREKRGLKHHGRATLLERQSLPRKAPLVTPV